MLRALLRVVQQASVKCAEPLHRLQGGRTTFLVQHLELLRQEARLHDMRRMQ
jgi:hypothetical protein